MAALARRGMNTFMTIVGASTLVTGVYLLWRFTGEFDPVVVATRAGAAFAIGGFAGILAGIVGGGVVGRSAGKVAALMSRAASVPDARAQGPIIEEAAALRRRMKAGARVVLALQTAALVLMALGHYI